MKMYIFLPSKFLFSYNGKYMYREIYISVTVKCTIKKKSEIFQNKNENTERVVNIAEIGISFILLCMHANVI